MNNLNYGVIGNCRTAALISEKGNIELYRKIYGSSPVCGTGS